jgi:hypothetical protein
MGEGKISMMWKQNVLPDLMRCFGVFWTNKQGGIKYCLTQLFTRKFINEEARQQLFRPYQPSSGLKYKNAECLSVN